MGHHSVTERFKTGSASDLIEVESHDFNRGSVSKSLFCLLSLHIKRGGNCKTLTLSRSLSVGGIFVAIHRQNIGLLLCKVDILPLSLYTILK